MNLPNSITMTRIIMIPLFLWILSSHFPGRGLSGEQEILASILFVLASITDGLDGYLARKRGQITTIGMLLDPLADKIMVTAAFIALVAYNPEVVKVWIVVVIIGREFLISGLRSIASSEGFTITASELGKLKTVVQIVSVVSAILAHRWDQWRDRRRGDSGQVVCDRRNLLYRGCFHNFRDRLFHRLLETDRSRIQRPAQSRSAFARQERPNLVEAGNSQLGVASRRSSRLCEAPNGSSMSK